MSACLNWHLLSQTPTPTTPAADPTPEPVKTSITVAEQVSTETPSAISVLGRTDVQRQAGVSLDDRLRSLPGFSLFRRSSSLVANPTTQGVSLRGLGTSGASRTLVLWDGIPINDPFGGWVYWTRVDPEELDRVEVSRGASTSVFGDRAMSGSIGLFSRPAERYRFTGAYEGGNNNTHALSGGFSNIFWNRFAASIRTRAVTTDGYYIVPRNRRGSADSRAGVEFLTGDVRLDYLGTADKLFIKLDILAESRANGTTLTHNSTGLGTIAANYSREWSNNGISILGYHTREQFHSAFSSVSTDRNTERLLYNQTVPSEATGAAGFYRYNGKTWNILGGADAQRVEGYSTDRLLPSGERFGGGSQLQHGTFAQGDLSTGLFKFFGGLRHQFTGQDQTFVSPSGGLLVGKGWIRGRGTVYRSFRAPTLNELYREFRVGNTSTLANAMLRPEKLFGAEAGVDLVGERSRASLTFFRNSIDDVITNVTLSTSPTAIVRQRQNAATALTRGADLQARTSWRDFQFEAGYLFADSRLATGERIAQVPRHQGSGQLTYLRGKTLISAGVRSYSLQFDDDRNQFLLPGFASVQVSARQRLTESLSASLAIENLLDHEYLTGLSTFPTIGPPRLWRVGLRWEGRIR